MTLHPPNNTIKKKKYVFLCNKNHFTHRCLLTRQIRDGKLKPPQNFCQKHCGKVFDLCGKNKCYIIHSKSGKSYNLTCKKPDHGTKHFLLCPSEGCRKASEKWWKKQNELKEVINLIPAEDLENLDSEQIDIDYEDFNTKIELSDHIFVEQLYVPTMAIKNDDPDPITHHFLKTFFCLEKVNAIIMP